MTTELHQLSVAIGKLQAQAEESNRNDQAIWERLDAINAKLAPLPQLVAELAELKPKVAAHEQIKQRGIGFALGIGGVSSAGTIGLWELARTLFRKTGGP